MANYGYPYSVPYPMPQNNGTQNGYNMPQNVCNVPQSNFQADERIWVANEQAAECYFVAANSMVRLWDSNKNVFYVKKADATGRLYPMEAYEYRKIEPNRGIKENEPVDYQKQINSLNERILALEGARKHEQSNTNNKRVKDIHE